MNRRSAAFMLGSETLIEVVGDGFCAHPDLDHGAVCRKAGVLLDVFSPVREDFLSEDEK